MKAFYDHRPATITAVGNGNHIYCWDIKEETVEHEVMGGDTVTTIQYVCNEATIHGKPTYGKCVEGVIRESYTAEEEIAMLNKYNSYQNGVVSNDDIVEEYERYLRFVKATKEMVRNDFGMEEEEVTYSRTPRLSEVALLMRMSINTMQLSDNDSLKVKSLYPNWVDFIGKPLAKDMKVQYGESLFKVVQDISVVLENQFPSMNTAALYAEVCEEHAGTLDDPIPYKQGMAFTKGLYYTQYGVTYLCILTTTTGHPNDLKDLPTIVKEV